jgi:hypothetical protein
MPAPLERLQKIADNFVPSKVEFVGTVTANSRSVRVEIREVEQSYWRPNPEDAELQSFLYNTDQIWNEEKFEYEPSFTAHDLWHRIQGSVLSGYETFSTRCNATKRKTDMYIRGLHLEKDKHVANFVIDMFCKLNQPAFDALPRSEKSKFFEPLEALRRTNAKRSV